MAYSGKYETPTELLLDESLSRDEKVKMLKQWHEDEKDLLLASSEGMEGDDRPDILKAVKKALLSLDEDGY